MYICDVLLSDVSFSQHITDQLRQTTWLEWLGTISGFFCVYLAAKQHILNWPIAIISIISYALLFFEYKLYGDSALQLYFLGTSIYGWHYWIQRKQNTERPVTMLSRKEIFFTILLIFFLSALTGILLDIKTDTNVPYADGFCTAVSLVAQFLLSRKVIQNWILWIIVDTCYIPLYIYKDLYLTAILYALFLVLAVIGYKDWKKSHSIA